MRTGDYVYLAVGAVIGLVLLIGLFCTGSYEKKQTKKETVPVSVSTEIPVGTIKCVKPGYKYCIEYRIFRETNQ